MKKKTTKPIFYVPCGLNAKLFKDDPKIYNVTLTKRQVEDLFNLVMAKSSDCFEMIDLVKQKHVAECLAEHEYWDKLAEHIEKEVVKNRKARK